jgi:hypothetical protein
MTNMSDEKPHKGHIESWSKSELLPGIEVVFGIFSGHPEFPEASFGRTSPLVSHDEATGEIETFNSRYTLGRPWQ